MPAEELPRKAPRQGQPPPPRADPEVPWPDRMVGLLLVLAIVALALHKIVEHDLWWQLKTGAWIVENGWPKTDPFSFAFPQRPWIEMRWLYCIAVHIVYQSLGLNFLILGKALLLVVVFFVLWRAAPRATAWARNLGVACALALAHNRFLVRPELLTYLFLCLFLLCLFRYRDGGNRRWLYLMPGLQILWTNSHTLFILGPVCLWLFWLCEGMTTRLLSRGCSAWQMAPEPHRLEGERLRWLGWTALLSTAACLVNPYFLRGALFPFSLFSEIRSSHAFSSWIDEFRSPFAFAGFNSFFASYILVTAMALAGFVFNRRRLSLSLAALLAAFFYLSTQAQRNVALFGLVAGLSVACNWGRPERAARPKRAVRAHPAAATLMRGAVALYASVMVLAAASDAYYRRTDTAKRFGFGVSPHRFPIRALAFVRTEKLPLPVISGLGDGGYVLFEGGARSVFIDGRLEVYGPEAIGQALRFLQAGTGLDDWVRRTGIETIVLRHQQDVGLLQTLERSPDWRAVYFDSIHVVYLRSTASTREQIAHLAIDWRSPRRSAVAAAAELNPKDWLAGWWPKVADHREALALGKLFLQVGNLPLARTEWELALSQAPDDPDTCLHLGLLYAAQGHARRSRALLERVDLELLQRPEILTLGGFIQEQMGDSAAALTSYRRAVQAGGRARFNYVNLARVALATQRWEEAYSGLQRLAWMSDSSPVDWNNLGVLAARMGRHQQAVADFRRSLRLDRNQPSVYNQMGASYGALGSLDQARQAFRQALALDPKYQLARANLERLSRMR